MVSIGKTPRVEKTGTQVIAAVARMQAGRRWFMPASRTTEVTRQRFWFYQTVVAGRFVLTSHGTLLVISIQIIIK